MSYVIECPGCGTSGARVVRVPKPAPGRYFSGDVRIRGIFVKCDTCDHAWKCSQAGALKAANDGKLEPGTKLNQDGRPGRPSRGSVTLGQ